MRIGSKQLRNRWEMRSWFDLNVMIGDAYTDFCNRMRYCIPLTDSNRSRWPIHEHWDAVTAVVAQDLGDMCSGVAPDDVKTANREEHKRVLETQIRGLMVSRAAAEGIPVDHVEEFFSRHIMALREMSRTILRSSIQKYCSRKTKNDICTSD